MATGSGQNPNFYHITCYNVSQSNTGAVEEWVYKSAPVTLNGVPPATGWEFYHQSCCRNPSTNVTGQPSWKLRAKMYPYNNQNTYPCFDNSPQFAAVTRSVIDAGFPSNFKQMVSDPELDSLVYDWGEPQLSGGGNITYNAGYSSTSPLPGPAQNPNNIAATINPSTGMVSYTSNTSGAFVVAIKITSFKMGQKVAEIWREVQFVLRATTGNNTPPEIINFDNVNGLDTVIKAGDLISIPITAIDNQYLPLTPPVAQTIFLDAYGDNFGKYVGGANPIMLDTAGCQYRPCATLNPPIQSGSPIYNQHLISTFFNWQTSCEHLQPPYLNSDGTANYVFSFVVKDDYCPFPAERIYELNIKLLPTDSLKFAGPNINCIKVNNNNSVELSWNKANKSIGLYNEYRIYQSNIGGTFNLVGKTTNINDTTFLINTTGKNKPMEFKVSLFSNCAVNDAHGDIMSSIFLKAYQISNSKTMLNWNEPLDTLPSNYTDYYVYKSTSANNWSLITTTSNTSFMDTLSHNINNVKYRVEISNSICTSTSNEAKILPSGIDETNLSEKIKIYPNPAKDFLKLEWESELQIDLVEVYNTSSQLVLKQEIRTSDRNAQLDLKGLSKGIYIVILKGDGINYLEKVLIE